MKSPYTTKELDDLIGACVEYTDQHEPYFYTGNICGRTGVSVDTDVVKRMMDWAAETDRGVLEFSGFGKDNISYFRLGRDARQVMKDGGFEKYLRRRTAIERLELVKSWSPMCIALLALFVSVLAWQAPKGSSNRIDDIAAQLHELQIRQDQTKSTVATLQAGLDTVVSQLRKTRTDRR